MPRLLPDNIAFVIADLASGGAQRVLVRMAQLWSDRGYRVTVITLADPRTDFYELNGSIGRISLAMSGASKGLGHSLFANAGRIAALRRAIVDSGARLVVSFVHMTNILTVLACTGLSVAVVVSERNDPVRQPLPWIWRQLRRLTYRWATLVTANSTQAIAAMSRYVPRRKLVWLPNPIALATTRSERQAGAPVVLAVGRLVHQKGFDVLLSAFAVVLRREPACRMVIVGEGPLKAELEAMAASLGVAHAVDWRPPTVSIGALYAEATLLALPSRFEGTPNVVLEAMASGLFVVVSDRSGGALDFVTSGESGLVVPAESSADLAEALLVALTQPAERRRMAHAAWERVQPWTGEHAAETWERLLRPHLP